MTFRYAYPALAALCCLFMACGGGGPQSDAPPRFQVRVAGETPLVLGIPSDDLADSWEIQFDAFLVAVDDIGGRLGFYSFPVIIDLVAGDATALDVETTAGRISPFDFHFLPATAESRNVNASLSDADVMIARGYSAWIRGTASRGATTISFSWPFTVQFHHHDCDTDGEVPAAGVGFVEITIHPDHLFHDSLLAPDPVPRFDIIAQQDLDGDGEVTPEELMAFDGIAFQALDRYDANAAVTNLWEYLERSVQTITRTDGEGTCFGDPR